MSTLFLIVVLVFLAPHSPQSTTIFDVTNSKYGGKQNSDISLALSRAWSDACSTRASAILVPIGRYRVQQALLQGPCLAPIQFLLQGTLEAPQNRLSPTGWIKFQSIDKLTLSGGGILDGKGASCWNNKACKASSVDIEFNKVNNSMVKGITAMNSRKFHITVLQCNSMNFESLIITAPANSPNTDGIHISRSTGVNVSHTIISTGDDCVSIGQGSEKVFVTNVTCGPGHGISIGSLGLKDDEAPVMGVTVHNCTMKETSNGIRIKTWLGGRGTTTVSQLQFEDMIMENAKNPILIDQQYCPDGICATSTPSKVKISDVTFRKFRGTSATQAGLVLNCSALFPCQKVRLVDISLSYTGKGTITSRCSHVNPLITRVSKPLACQNSRG